MILVTNGNGEITAREDWEGGDLDFCIEDLQPLPATAASATSEGSATMLVTYPQEAA